MLFRLIGRLAAGRGRNFRPKDDADAPIAE
jgi:hypothetical protein